MSSVHTATSCHDPRATRLFTRRSASLLTYRWTLVEATPSSFDFYAVPHAREYGAYTDALPQSAYTKRGRGSGDVK